MRLPVVNGQSTRLRQGNGSSTPDEGCRECILRIITNLSENSLSHCSVQAHECEAVATGILLALAVLVSLATVDATGDATASMVSSSDVQREITCSTFLFAVFLFST